MLPEDDNIAVSALLQRLRAGDVESRELLISRTCNRLETIARRQLHDFPLVRRWEDTADVLQAAMMRLYRALAKVTPDTPRDFFALSARMIRRELLDLKRHYYGPEGMGAHHATHANWQSTTTTISPIDNAEAASLDPAGLAEWTEFHRQVELLPDNLREVVDLLWYQELSHDEAAGILGVDSRTIRRRWREARMRIGQALHL